MSPADYFPKIEPTEEESKISAEVTELRDKLIARGYNMLRVSPARFRDGEVLSATSCMVDDDNIYGEEVYIDKPKTKSGRKRWFLTVMLRDKGRACFSTESQDELIEKFVETMKELRA